MADAPFTEDQRLAQSVTDFLEHTEKHGLLGETQLQAMATIGRIPTHRCKICHAWWILYQGQPDRYLPDHPFHGATWSLFSPKCGKCCDNVAMGEQIELLTYDADDLRFLINHGPEYFGSLWREATSADIFVARNHHGRLQGD